VRRSVCQLARLDARASCCFAMRSEDVDGERGVLRMGLLRDVAVFVLSNRASSGEGVPGPAVSGSVEPEVRG
jgi:hypothetical protein